MKGSRQKKNENKFIISIIVRMNNRVYIVSLIVLVFFVISFLTNILGPIIPDIIKDFELSLGFAGFLPFALLMV